MVLCSTSFAETPGAVPWTPAECGAEPEKPVVDLSDLTKYNKSVDEVKAYKERAEAWNTCVVKEANAAMATVHNDAQAKITVINEDAKAKMTGISESANQIQSKLSTEFHEYTEQFKAAQEKLSKPK